MTIIPWSLIRIGLWIKENQPYVYGARYLVKEYFPNIAHLWIPGYAFPSQHIIITTFIFLVIIRTFQKLTQKSKNICPRIIFTLVIVYLMMLLYSTIHVGDHFIHDLVINGIIGLVSYWIYTTVSESHLTRT